jgi:superfamily I DNA/RNA helicase
MNIQPLIKEDGTPFDPKELEKISNHLDQLQEKERREFRDMNCKAIAENKSEKLLIVSGPGTGKTLLFLDRIKYWLKKNPDAKVFVTTFVRKLAEDLNSAIDKEQELTNKQKKQITVFTLHKFARSIVEKNRGTSEWPFKTYFKIITGPIWEKIVWEDVLAFHPKLDQNDYDFKKFKEQLYNNEFNHSVEWQRLRQMYFELCKFYNATGFADLIIRARVALEENSQLNEDNFFIIDEYQDFNSAEDGLIRQLVKNSEGLLIVGDDDQVLYERLKCGRAALIRGLYKNKDFAKAMLPFCSRNSFHITKAVAYFIQQFSDPDRIEKIFLPCKIDQNVQKVRLVACAVPSTAVDYIKRFIKSHKKEIDERKTNLENGEEKDAFLLILTPDRKIDFFGKCKEEIHQLVADYKVETREFSEDFYKILDYYLLSEQPQDNFLFRKVSYHEKYTIKQVHELIIKATQDEIGFCKIDSEKVKNILDKCENIKKILDDSETSLDKKIDNLSEHISISNRDFLKKDIEHWDIKKAKDELERIEEISTDVKEIRRMNAIEIMTIVGSKGLSADNVIIVGFDDVNMKYVTKNAFYVATARARKSLHILTALKSGGATKAHGYLDQLPEEHLEFHKHTKEKATVSLSDKDCFCNYLSYICDKQRGK